MPLDTRTSAAARNAQVSGVTALLNGGRIRIYSGTRPATADTALSGNTLLAELTFGSPAFAAPSGGTAAANAITADASADNAGTATFARLFQSDGTTVVMDVSAGRNGYAADGTTVSGGAVYNLDLNAAVIAANANVSATSFSLNAPAQGA